MTPLTLHIDGREVEAIPGDTILNAARKLGLDIPTLCFLEKCSPSTSCLVCLVKVKNGAQGKLVPSCATKVQPGMIVESETDEVRDARRTALELLFSDHAGDCLSPCHRICPLQMNIPLMIRQIESGRLDSAIVTIKAALALPVVLGRLCHHPCENGCRRATWDQAASIREMERHVAEHDLASRQPYLPRCQPATGKSVIIVGSGPTGLAAASHLAQAGHACTVIDRHEEAGGSLGALDEPTLPRRLLQGEIDQLEKIGVQFKYGVELGNHVSLEGLQRGFDAVLLATGELLKDEARKLGLPVAAAGLKVDASSGQVSPVQAQEAQAGAAPNLSQVFAAGSAVKPVKQIVRAIGDGHLVARSINQFLSGQKIARAEKPFSSIMGRLEDGEIDLFMRGPSASPRVEPTCGGSAGFTDDEACAEAQRCLHCDCRAAGNCKLQHYAELYDADAGRFRQQRRRFEQEVPHADILFEPGKCILCGLCIQLAEQAREPLGLTFIDRGFDVRVSAPLNHTITEGLQKAAAECVKYCPTGALAFKKPEAADPAKAFIGSEHCPFNQPTVVRNRK